MFYFLSDIDILIGYIFFYPQTEVGLVKDVTHSKFNDRPNSVFKAVPEILET